MQKYNQGFGCFGPMEKCDGGKWVKSEDAEREIGRIKAERGEMFDAYFKSLDMISEGHLKIACLGILTTVGWGIIVVALVKYAFTGHIL